MVGIKKTLIVGSTVIDKDAVAPYFFKQSVIGTPTPPDDTNNLILSYDVDLSGISDLQIYLDEISRTEGINGQINVDINGTTYVLLDGVWDGTEGAGRLDLTGLTGSGLITVTGQLTSSGVPALIFRPLNSNSIPITGVISYGEIVGLEGVHIWEAPVFVSVPSTISPYFTNADLMIYYAPNFNDPNIGAWDVSNITSMIQMLEGNTSFNQNLTCWDVEQIPEEPIDFSWDTLLIAPHKPRWGQSISDPSGRTGPSCSDIGDIE